MAQAFRRPQLERKAKEGGRVRGKCQTYPPSLLSGQHTTHGIVKKYACLALNHSVKEPKSKELSKIPESNGPLDTTSTKEHQNISGKNNNMFI